MYHGHIHTIQIHLPKHNALVSETTHLVVGGRHEISLFFQIWFPEFCDPILYLRSHWGGNR